MKQGTVIFDERTGRMDIRFGLADYYGGLHCGECFDVIVWTFSTMKATRKSLISTRMKSLRLPMMNRRMTRNKT